MNFRSLADLAHLYQWGADPSLQPGADQNRPLNWGLQDIIDNRAQSMQGPSQWDLPGQHEQRRQEMEHRERNYLQNWNPQGGWGAKPPWWPI